MDIKTAFLNEPLKEEVQAPRAWYVEHSNFLVSKGFSKSSIDPTLFITKHGEDILLVQICVDDIIFRRAKILSKNSDSPIPTCPMANPDDEPMWAADRVVTPTPGLTITIPATANEFAIKGNHMDAMTMKMDARYKEMKSRTECNHCGGMPNYGKFLKELVSTKHKLEQISLAFLSDESSAIIQNKVPPKLGDPRSFLIPCTFSKTFSYNTLANLGASINLMPYSLYAKLSLETLKPTKISIDVINEILEEDFDALLDEGSKILYSIKGTPLEDKIFAEFNEFIAMNFEESNEPKIIEEEITFKKITFDTDYKINKSLDKPPTDLELKPLPGHLKYAFLEEPFFLPVIVSSWISEQNKEKLISVLKRHNQAFVWKTTDILSIYPSFCKHKFNF
nr:DNA-directed DNA polymerase [Tanacetum cinerariifolium]